MTTRLDVRLRGKQIATLERADGGALTLHYEPQISQSDRLSLALPPRAEPYGDDACRNVLDWLLPEGHVRSTIAQRIHTDPEDTFSLLAACGRECAGAVQFVTAGEDDSAPSVRWLTPHEFDERIAELSTHPFLSFDEEEIELSLGGVQEKALVVLDEERIGLPQHGALSTHIVKPDISDKALSVLAEYFALKLAGAVGLSVAEAELRAAGGRWLLLVRRFDRLVDASGKLRREHSETMAQALNVAPRGKYQHRGGPGFAEMAEVLRRHSSNPVRDLQGLAQLGLFNMLIGNADAHAGNYGLMLYANGSVRLAPAYDLLPVRAMLGKDPKGYAMQIGSSYDFTPLTEERTRAYAAQLGVGARGMLNLLHTTADALRESAPRLAAEIRSTHQLNDEDDTLLTAAARDIVARCEAVG